MKFYAPWAKEAFDKYTSNYDLSNGMINLKVVHTMAVVGVMNRLTNLLNLPEHTKYLAEICAVFHDIGRFEQVRKYKTFLDNLSVNHAELGCKVIVENNLLYPLSDSEKQQVITAIINHNVYAIDPNITGETLTLCKLIRDADKCDIFRVFACEEMTDTMGETYEQVSKETVTRDVMNCFLEHRTIPKTIRKTGLDIWISFLAFFFDFNFKESIEIAKDDGYYIKPFERISFEKEETRLKVAIILDDLKNFIS